MSDEVKGDLVKREAKYAVEDFEQELARGMETIAEMMAKYHEDPEEEALPTMLMVALVLENIRGPVYKAVENFKKRTNLG